jgi:CRISPR-associated endonuclease/helicase Cas3
MDRYCTAMFPDGKSEIKELLKEFAVQLIVFHDLGKSNPKFQRETMKNKDYRDDGLECISSTRHSLLSALFYLDYFLGKIEDLEEIDKREKKKMQILLLEHSYVIAKHHGDFSSLNDYCNVFKTTEVENIMALFSERKISIYKIMGSSGLTTLKTLLSKYRTIKLRDSDEQNRMEYFYYRFLYSLLVSCDYYATSEEHTGMEQEQFGSVRNPDEFIAAYSQSEILTHIRNFENCSTDLDDIRFEKITNINELRNLMFLETERTLLQDMTQNIYFLEAPTGSGKSNMALNLSMHLMKDKKKLYYIYPYNTLVEQNRQNLLNLFEDKKIAEQIVVVNSLTPIKTKGDEENSSAYYQKALLDRQFLNYPVILSTHVSFFNTLFGCQKEDLFGFLQLSDAVVVLDEIQSYKNSIWAEIILMLKSCANLMGMKIIIMSATLPNLEVLGGKECEVKYLIPKVQKYYQHHLFRDRVKISYELLDSAFSLDFLLHHVEHHSVKDKKVMIEFISKKTAEIFYQMIKDSEKISVPIYYITGDCSLDEREKILKPIRKNSISGCVLVATQVIEAGVDIDMDIGYKDISKLDSDEQFMGRINRSFKKNGKVYFFNYDNQNLIYKNDFEIPRELTLSNKEMRVLLEQKNFQQYYRIVLKSIRQVNESSAEVGLESFHEKIAVLNYTEIEERMRLIEDDQWHMDIYLCRKIKLEDGRILDGFKIWNRYKALLQAADMDYAEKQVKLSEVRSEMNYFIYSVKQNVNLSYHDVLGELRMIEDGEKYFVDGVLRRELLERDNILFVD